MDTREDLSILLAEDNVINQRIAAYTFRQMGLICDIASDGEEAFNRCQKKKYDLIFMDLHMPVMDGIEATQLIRAFEKESGLQHRAIIVAITASELYEKKESCFEAGMDEFMEKPFHKEALRELISRSFK
ncbi:MAG TPA: response regulator [Prolixibacteraceae bacterium]|nr:response regulator [Prolixibacteraceae bacterium]